jgi:hypothetical protein
MLKKISFILIGSLLWVTQESILPTAVDELLDAHEVLTSIVQSLT